MTTIYVNTTKMNFPKLVENQWGGGHKALFNLLFSV
jgi:hypothetical protein